MLYSAKGTLTHAKVYSCYADLSRRNCHFFAVCSDLRQFGKENVFPVITVPFQRKWRFSKRIMNNYSEQGTESLKIRETFRNSSTITEKKYSFYDAAMSWYGNMSPLTKDSTRMKYLNELNPWLLPFFAEMDIRQITRQDVHTFCSRLLTDKSGARKTALSSNTVSGIMVVFRQIMDYATTELNLDVINTRGIFTKQRQESVRVFTLREQ